MSNTKNNKKPVGRPKKNINHRLNSFNISESSTKSPSFVDSDDSLYEVDKRPVGRPNKNIIKRYNSNLNVTTDCNNKNINSLSISESSTKSPSFVNSDDSLYKVEKIPVKRPVGRPKRKIISDSGYHTESPCVTEPKNMLDKIKRPVGRPKKDGTLENIKDTNKSNSLSVSNKPSDAPLTRLRSNFGKLNTLLPNYCELNLELDKHYVSNVDSFEGSDIKRNVDNILAEYKMRNAIKNYQTYLELKMKENELIVVLIS